MIRLATLLVALAALPVRAEEVVAGLSQNRVSITANFDGSEILVFGAVKRETKVPEDAPPLEVVIAIAGPSEPLIVRRKERVAGIWVNRRAVEVDAAPSFYKIATSGPLSTVLSNVEDLRHRISLERVIRAVGAPADVEDASTFTEALMRIRKREELYQVRENTVDVTEGTLFRTSVALPANLRQGDYTVRIFLTRGGAVVDQHETALFVQKVGLERFLYNLAYDRPLVYGLMSLAIAIAAGWLASAVFRYVRGS
ncbi:MAG: TIGR02186 family protein [Pseudomonadota bacterium]